MHQMEYYIIIIQKWDTTEIPKHFHILLNIKY